MSFIYICFVSISLSIVLILYLVHEGLLLIACSVVCRGHVLRGSLFLSTNLNHDILIKCLLEVFPVAVNVYLTLSS